MSNPVEMKSQMEQLMADCGVPGHMRDSFAEYILSGRPAGGFLEAVLSNDLVGALGRADMENQQAMMAYATYLYNYAPSDCWGSREKIANWMERGGLLGREHSDL